MHRFSGISTKARQENNETMLFPEPTVDDDGREVYLVGEVNSEKAGMIIAALRRLDRSAGLITLVVSSIGGDEGAGWAIYDTLRLCRNKTEVHCLGECQSIATLILQGGDVRKLSEHCRFMIHNGSITLEATNDQLRSIAAEVNELTTMYYQVLSMRSGKTLELIKKWCDDETFMSAQQTIDNGLADGMLTKPQPRAPRKRKTE